MIQEVCEPGKCVGCGKSFKEVVYTEVSCTLTNGSVMRVGCCVGCCSTILVDKAALWGAVVRGWRLEQDKQGWADADKREYREFAESVTIA